MLHLSERESWCSVPTGKTRINGEGENLAGEKNRQHAARNNALPVPTIVSHLCVV
jgi:hypothetical protein